MDRETFHFFMHWAETYFSIYFVVSFLISTNVHCFRDGAKKIKPIDKALQVSSSGEIVLICGKYIFQFNSVHGQYF